MQKTNHVHRDVSAGNIIFYDQRGKISDLEFSAVYDPDADSSRVHTSLTVSALCLMVKKILMGCS
jgi:aminoglycoside phosphotransferase (APT) family kinase protein